MTISVFFKFKHENKRRSFLPCDKPFPVLVHVVSTHQRTRDVMDGDESTFSRNTTLVHGRGLHGGLSIWTSPYDGPDEAMTMSLNRFVL